MLDELARWLFDSQGLTPHGFCLLWEPGLIWLHAVSDIAVGTAYFTIPAALLVVAKRRKDLVFRPVFLLFAAFILLCGTTHWLELLTLWVPAYGLQGAVKGATAATSVLTALALWRLLPEALALPSPAQLRDANAALGESEGRHRAGFERSPAPLCTLDREGVVVSVSDSWLALLGYTRADVTGRHIGEFSARDGGWTDTDLARLIAEGEVRDLPRRFQRRDGVALDTLVTSRLEQGDSHAWVMCAVTDVTARRHAEAALRASEERLRQAQKMEAIGQLTAGIAHDFNNVLTVVMGNVDLMRRRLADDRPDLSHLADSALQSAQKATRLTAQLLSFGRRQRLEPQSLHPLEVIEGMSTLLARTTGERITLRIEADDGLGECLADRNQLESAVLNLAINARDAIAGNGTITVSLQNTRVDRATADGPASGSYVRIAMRDTGSGMSEEVSRHAFEPFFTTKGPGRGSGLGLAQIHGFAHQSGGSVSLRSAPGQGTEVAILLPRAAEAAPRRAPTRDEATAAAPAGAGETVLLVEDDPAVRATLAAILRDLRYRVLEAELADAALATLASTGPVDAVLTDFAMPGPMDGLEFAEAARKRRPNLAIVLVTGGPIPVGARQLPGGMRFLPKPCDHAGVAAALRQALGGGTPSLAA